jgi:2'-5' RNA ligase
VKGISAFPSIPRARVIWYGIESHTQLLTLHRAVAQGLKGKNLVEQLETRQYTPHITVGRAKGRVKSLLLDEIRRHENEDFGKTIMDSLILFKSTLSQKGPVYERLLSFSL